MRRPCEVMTTITKDNGCIKNVKTFSYVALLTEINGDEVKAVRYDGYTSKYDLKDIVAKVYPEWNLKGIWKLYDAEFRKKEHHHDCPSL